MYQLFVAFQLFFTGHSVEGFEEESDPVEDFEEKSHSLEGFEEEGDSVEGFEGESHSVEGFEGEDIAPGKLEYWQTAVALWTLAIGLFSATVLGIVAEKDTLWITSLSVVALLLVAALVVSVLAYRSTNRTSQSRRHDHED